MYQLTDILLICLLVLCAAGLIFSIINMLSVRKETLMLRELLDEAGDDITDRVSDRISDIQDDIGRRLMQDSTENRQNRIEVSDLIRRGNHDQRLALERSSELQNQKLSALSETQNAKLGELQEKQFEKLSEQTEKIQSVLKETLSELQEANRRKLDEIQGEINKKLDNSLNERLDESFKTVGEQLSQLYKSLGELGKLESGVSSLNRTLSNVKTRGILGEAQLENILASILANTLYDKNVSTKPGSRDTVEFAVKIPDKEVPGNFMYLPIDSKFPTTIYDRICDAAESGDADGLLRAQKELEQRIRSEARSIFEKYVEPPRTTDFALMFLPTESLYAEVLRIPGLTEECQRRFHIVITGPTTIAALLNSLSIGFRYMAVNRDSQNILRLLSAIKTQYGTLQSLIETAGSRIDLAKKATNDLRRRTDLINRKLSSVEEIDSAEAQELLGVPASDASDVAE